MTIKIIDSLALASLDEAAKVQRIAALWCREQDNRWPTCRDELENWVRDEFGCILDQEHLAEITRVLLEETRRQIGLRRRRQKSKTYTDHLTTPAGSGLRIARLLNSRLGPAQSWASRRRIRTLSSECLYIDGAFFSGLVAGLIPTEMRTRRFYNPNLLVYRRGFEPPQTWWVPGHITKVADAFIWVIPPAVGEFLSLPGSRVEHDAKNQTVRLITEFGEKVLPWRSLLPDETEPADGLIE